MVGADLLEVDKTPLLTVTCIFSRYVFAWQLRDSTSHSVIKALQTLFMLEGPPNLLVTDNGKCFTSTEFTTFMQRWRVYLRHIPRSSPHRGGFYERSHGLILQTLRALLLEYDTNAWKSLLSLALFYINHRPYDNYDDEVLSPFMVFRGRSDLSGQKPLEVEDPFPTEEVWRDNLKTIRGEQQNIRERFEEIWRFLRERSYKTIRDRQRGPELLLKSGDLVMVYQEARTRQKLDPRWVGPFEVEEILGSAKARVNGRVEDFFNLKLAKSGKRIQHDNQKKRILEENGDIAEQPDKKRRSATIAAKRLGVNSINSDEMTSEKSGGVLLWRC